MRLELVCGLHDMLMFYEFSVRLELISTQLVVNRDHHKVNYYNSMTIDNDDDNNDDNNILT